MTCHELRSYFQDLHFQDLHCEDLQRAGLRIEPASIAEHAALCSDCNRFLEEQRELQASLRMMRDSAPEVPHSLDAAVLAGYRQYASAKSSVRVAPARKRINFIAALAWSAALVAAIFIAGEGLHPFWPTEDAVTSTIQPPAVPAQAAPQTATHPTVAVQQPSPGRRASTSAIRQALATRPKTAAQHVADIKPSAPQTENSTATAADQLPVGFRSLMYCDALSCGGPMQMIRVQLPPSAAGLTSGSAPSEMVYADVLVGPDGIARGIRILK